MNAKDIRDITRCAAQGVEDDLFDVTSEGPLLVADIFFCIKENNVNLLEELLLSIDPHSLI